LTVLKIALKYSVWIFLDKGKPETFNSVVNSCLPFIRSVALFPELRKSTGFNWGCRMFRLSETGFFFSFIKGSFTITAKISKNDLLVASKRDCNQKQQAAEQQNTR
jgi:hypothetical protein